MGYPGKSTVSLFKRNCRGIQRVLYYGTLLFNLPIILPAQTSRPTLGFTQLSVNDGLSENTVRTIIEDSRGYMWFGSEDGLNRFDGYTFTAYHTDKTEKNTLSSRNIKFLYNDTHQNLWILTTNGANIYNPTHDNFYNYRNQNIPALKSLGCDVNGITEDLKGNTWIATMDEGLFKIKSLQENPEHYAYPYADMSKHFLSLFSENDSTLWIGTSDGLLTFNPLNGQYKDCRSLYGKGYDARQIIKDSLNRIWLSTTKGLKMINAQHQLKEYSYDIKQPEGISGNNLTALVPYKNGTYLIGVDGGGVDLFDPASETFLHYRNELSSRNVVSIYKDSKSDLWVGTYLNGINYSNSTTNLFILHKNNPLSNLSIQEGIVTNFLKDSQGDLWVTTDGGGLYRKRAGQENYQHYSIGQKGLSSNALISIIEDRNGNVWISSYGGGLMKYSRILDRFDTYAPQANKSGTLFSSYTKALQCFQNDLWISGFGAGIDVLHLSTGLFEHFSNDKNNPRGLPADWVQKFYTDKKGDLWLCTFGGLSKYHPKTHDFTTYRFKSAKSIDTDINSIVDMTEDDKGNLWLGTLGAGLICFQPSSGAYTNYTTKQGLSNNCIKALLMDDHACLWLSTNSGISMFNTKTRKGKGYTTKDGLPSCSFYLNSKYKTASGLIYLGTNNGYLVIDPLLNKTNERIPPVVITGLKISNQAILSDSLNGILTHSIKPKEELILPYDKNSISFEYSALNYNSSRNNRYAYWLEGFDKKWYYSGTQRNATYTNLDPGHYVFHVKGSNNDGIWNEKGTYLNIHILPPFWMTWWFYSLLAFVLLLFVLLLHQWRIRYIHNKNIALEQTVQQRTQDLRVAHEQLETFVYRTSHDIQGPLKSIMGLTLIGRKDIQDKAAKIYFGHILTSTKKLDKLLTDLTRWISQRHGNLKKNWIDFRNLMDEILLQAKNIPGHENLSVKLDITDHGEFCSDYTLLTSIIENIVENAILYADASKDKQNLYIHINANSEEALLIFEDNGEGIVPESQAKIFDLFYKASIKSNGSGLGLYLVKNALDQLGGTISLESKVGEGTKFTIYLKALT